MGIKEDPSPEKRSSTLDLLDQLREKGFLHTFALKGLEISCVETEISYPSSSVRVLGTYRFEGQSDPDDSRVVYAIETHDGTRGSIVDAFGIYASPELSQFLEYAIDARQERNEMKELPATKIVSIKIEGSKM